MKRLLAQFLAISIFGACAMLLASCSHKHSYNVWRIEKSPTCTEDGIRILKCECGDTRNQTTKKLGHTEGEWIVDVAADDKKEGKKHLECSKCGEILNEEIIPVGSMGLKYIVNSDGITCTITGNGTCKDVNLFIPQYIDNYKVTAIGERAFYLHKDFKSITIPQGIEVIGDYAFYGCLSVTSITIPEGVTEIGEYAFYCFFDIQSISLPESVTTIKRNAFEGTGITSIEIPNNVTCIDDYLFYCCDALTDITLGENITYIGEFAFSHCLALESIEIPDSVTSIRYEAFSHCESLKTVVIPNSVTSIGNWAFLHSGLTSVTIPDSITSISYGAFSNCTNLTSVVIPNSVTSIDSSAFKDCSSLTNVKFNGTVDEWKNITKDVGWNYGCSATEVICTDGTARFK